MTKNANQDVWRLISQDYAVQKDLKRGLLNTRALAKHLISEHKLTASIDAVISAIRRYSIENGFPDFQKESDELLSQVSIFTRDQVARVTVESHALHHLFDSEGSEDVRGKYRIIKSKKYAKVFVNEGDSEKISQFFPKDDLHRVTTGLAELRIIFPSGKEYVRGVLSRILNETTMRGVAVFDLIQCYPEVLVYVQREKLLEAHHAVLVLHDEALKSL